VALGDEFQFKAGNVRAAGVVIWVEADECAIEFVTPIAVAEVSRIRSLAHFISGVSKDRDKRS